PLPPAAIVTGATVAWTRSFAAGAAPPNCAWAGPASAAASAMPSRVVATVNSLCFTLICDSSRCGDAATVFELRGELTWFAGRQSARIADTHVRGRTTIDC